MPELADYTLVTLIDRKDDVTVWHARRGSDCRPVILKTSTREHQEPQLSARLQHEFSHGRQIRSPYILQYVDLVTDADHVAIVQEDFDGVPLATAIPADGLPLRGFVDVAIQLAEGLRAIHLQRLVLNDANPRDVLYDTDTGHLKYIELGFCDHVTGGELARGPIDGALAYIAPEQTRRINRPVDFRADLYGLGAVLYELLCGSPPFPTDDPLELVHGHLAKLPPDPRTIRPSIPDVIVKIVLKLLAKLPEDRYQSTMGLLADLVECRTRLSDGLPLEAFPLACHDVSEMFHLPRRLYGRDGEMASVRAAFDRVSNGAAELLLVCGRAGTGKSALIEQLFAPVVGRQGFFVTGKFEQLSHGVPYAAVRQVFRALVQHLLAQPDEQIQEWRASLAAALGDQAQVIVDIVPDIERLLGPQPPVESLGPRETQFRLLRMLQRFVRVFAAPDHPLVVFLDDWQWADEASLNLIESLLSSPDLKSLLLIGAYRDNEVDAEHPVTALLDRLRTRQFPVSRVALGPIAEDDVALLVSDALGIGGDRGAGLASELHRRTDGNPFFVRASLRDLYDARVLAVSDSGEWQWDSERLARVPPAENVVSLMAARITRLPAGTQEILQVGACLGSAFPAALLAKAAGRSESDVVTLLEPALDAGLILRDHSGLHFLHDRVQEAAYSLVSEARQSELQLAVGRRLIAALREDDPLESLVQAVQHLNAGRALIVTGHERLQLARLNLRAGRLARRATAYAAAAHHAAIGMDLVVGGWTNAYELTLDLHELRAECEYLAGNFDTADRLYPEALAAARTDLDRIRMLSVQKDQYELQGRYLDAIAVLRRGLALVGITFPDDEASLEQVLHDELRQIPVNLRGRRVADLVDADPLQDPLRVATLRLLMGLWPSCYVAGLQALLAVVSVKIANFSLQHGNCEITSAAYVNYSFVAGFITGRYDEAYEFGRVGIALADRYPDRSVRAWCYFLFGCGTLIWRSPLRDGRAYLDRAVTLGVESGNIASASYAASYIVTDSFMSGLPLDEVRHLHDRYVPFLKRNNAAIHLFAALGTQSLRRILGLRRRDEKAVLRDFGDSPFFSAVHDFGRLMAAYLFDDVEHGLRIAERALESVPRLLAGTFKAPETIFYAALLSARAFDLTEDAGRRSELRVRVGALRDRLQPLATQCPPNFAHKARLLDAEASRLEGRADAAAAAYEDAAALAAQHGFIHDQALAYEIAARFWRQRGFPRIAAASLADAVAAYERWGAVRKARWLEQRFPDLVQLRRIACAPSDVSPQARHEGEPLDLLSATKASQAISSEIDFDRLVARLIRIVSENAGARRAMLFLDDGSELVMAAAADVAADHVVVADRRPLADADVPIAIVRHVFRTGEPIVLHDAAHEGRFRHDPYVVTRCLRSVLCLPVRRQDAVIGALYLDNDLSSGVFTADRTAVLELLLGQLAISLENARLYGELRASMSRVEKARHEAERANRTKDQFLAMLGHELRNPLAPIQTACELMRLKAPEQFRREREVIDRQLRHVTRLVDDLLDVSRIARGKVELKPEPISAADVIARAVEVVEPLFEQRRVHLVTDVAPDLRVYADPVRLRQVIANLLNNAAKFSAVDRSVWLSCRRDGADVVVGIQDEGTGMTSDVLARVFDVFVQGPQSVDRGAGGLGLGLAIARSLVEMHGGTIRAMSDGPGRGSRFEVRLPECTGEPAARPGLQRPPGGATRRRVMVVDDNRDAAQLLAEALDALGHSTIVAYDAAEALATLDRETPDVALLDIGLPVVDGFELARRIRTGATGDHITLIALTGYGLPSDRQRALDAGFDHHLTKPVDLTKLQAALEAAL